MALTYIDEHEARIREHDASLGGVEMLDFAERTRRELLAELDATRARVAELEAKRAHESQHLLNCCADRDKALAEREAEVAELREAVESKLAEYERDDAEWRALKGLGDLPHDSALVEDWKAILAILSRAPGSSDALRAMLADCARLAARMAFSAYDAGGDYETFVKMDLPLIPPRLLGDARGETPRVDAEREGDR